MTNEKPGLWSSISRALSPGKRKTQPPGEFSGMPKWLLRSIQVGHMAYQYRGLPTAKDPFLGDLSPAAVAGASADDHRDRFLSRRQRAMAVRHHA